MATAQTKTYRPQPEDSHVERTHVPLNWPAALKSGLIAGFVLLVLPQGIPWAALDFFSGAVMGRQIDAHVFAGRAGFILLHFAVAIAYALVIAFLIRPLHSWRAILAGGIIGLALYFINLGVTLLLEPTIIGPEFRVGLSHVVFGLIAAAAYAGLRRRADEVQRRSHR